jgi:hypothetical protein
MEQEPRDEDWSTYRTVGEGWPDFYALLQVAPGADVDAVRLSINAAYGLANANRDHRDLRKRFYFQTLQEKVLPECRRVLLDAPSRERYDEQRLLHIEGAPDAIPYSRFLASLPGSRHAAPAGHSAPLDAALVAQELTAQLEARLAAQRGAQAPPPPIVHHSDDEIARDDMAALPVSSQPIPAPVTPFPEPFHEAFVPSEDDDEDDDPLGAPRQPASNAMKFEALPVGQEQLAAEADEAVDLDAPDALMSDAALSDAALSDAALPDAEFKPSPPRTARVLRMRGDGRTIEVADPVQIRPGHGASTAARPLGGAPQLRRGPRITVGTSASDSALLALGRRSQQRAQWRQWSRLGLGAAAVAVLASAATWGLTRGRSEETPSSGAVAVSPREPAPLQDLQGVEETVERAVTRAMLRTHQQTQAAASASAAASATSGIGINGPAATTPGAASTSSTSGGAMGMGGPRMRLDTLLLNADFEGQNDGDITPWRVWEGADKSGAGAAFASCASKEQDSRSGRWRLVFWHTKPYEASVSQVVTGLAPGLYQINAWTKRSGGQEWAGIVVAEHGGKRLHRLVPASTRWVATTVRDIRITSGRVKIGFYTRSPKGKKWFTVDAVEFHRQS